MTSVVVSDGGGNIVEYVTVVEEPQQVSLYMYCKSAKLLKRYWRLCQSLQNQWKKSRVEWIQLCSMKYLCWRGVLSQLKYMIVNIFVENYQGSIVRIKGTVWNFHKIPVINNTDSCCGTAVSILLHALTPPFSIGQNCDSHTRPKWMLENKVQSYLELCYYL